MVYTTEQLTQMKKNAEEKLNRKNQLKGKMEGIVEEVKKQFGVSSSKELKSLGETIQADLIKANTDYEEACSVYRETYDI